MLNPVTGEPMKLSKAQQDDIDRNGKVSPTSELLASLTKIAGSTGGSLLIVLALFPLVIRHLSSQIPQLAGIVATVTEAVKNPSGTADEFGEEMGDTILAIPSGFYSAIAGAGFETGANILGGVPTPFTSAETVHATGVDAPTLCDRFQFDLLEIHKKMEGAGKISKIQGTFAWIAKLYDTKKAGCARPGFVTQTTWDRVPD